MSTRDSSATDAARTDTLFYDGACPLCAKEIRQLREQRGGRLELVDIHTLNDAAWPILTDAPDELPEKDKLLRTLHLRRSNGDWLTGADANVAAWEGTAKERVLRLLRAPLIRIAVDGVYSLWARWRYWRLYRSAFDSDKHAPDAR